MLKELQAAEGIIGHKRSLHVMEKGSSSSSKKAQRKKNVPKRDAKPKQQQQQKPKARDGKPKGKCFTPVVRRVTTRTTALRSLNLRMVIIQVCLMLMSLKRV